MWTRHNELVVGSNPETLLCGKIQVTIGSRSSCVSGCVFVCVCVCVCVHSCVCFWSFVCARVCVCERTHIFLMRVMGTNPEHTSTSLQKITDRPYRCQKYNILCTQNSTQYYLQGIIEDHAVARLVVRKVLERSEFVRVLDILGLHA